MKKQHILRTVTLLLLVLAAIFTFAACADVDKTGAWETAVYDRNTELGEGANKIKVVIKTDDHQITLTVNTDKDNLGDALFELGIINDASFFDTVIGMRLDWNTDKAYWGFYKNGEYMMVDVNDAPVVGVEQYELVYTKG
jgi:hypothetical protein